MNEKTIERAKSRYAALRDGDHKTASEYATPDEECIIRTLQDAIDKGLATTYSKDKDPKTGKFEKVLKTNWAQSGRQMLTARVITEGIRLMAPGLIAGIVSEDEARDIADQGREQFGRIVAGAITTDAGVFGIGNPDSSVANRTEDQSVAGGDRPQSEG